MTDLTADEQRYLVQAFDASPEAWFRPTGVGQHYSDRQIDRLVAALVAAGMMVGQPDCHARLTDLGRKRAAQLNKPQRNRRYRRKVWLAVVSTTGVVVASLLLFWWSGIL